MIEETKTEQVCDIVSTEVAMDCRRVGIEIEVEHVPDYSTQYWKVTDDPSLRNMGREFVSYPIPLADVPRILEDFYKSFNKFGYKANQRTGIHVHVDARDYTKADIASGATTYSLTEPAFCDVVGPDREENIYCVPWYRADSDVSAMAMILRKDRGLRDTIQHLGVRMTKYSGFYLEPLQRFGTIEFRHAPTWETADEVEKWARMCWTLVEWSRGKPAADILKMYQDDTPSAFARHVFGHLYEPGPDYDLLCDKLDIEILAETLVDSVSRADDEELDEGPWVRSEGEPVTPQRNRYIGSTATFALPSEPVETSVDYPDDYDEDMEDY
jgi:hypothetical protein